MPHQRQAEFLQSLHARLLPRSRVVLLDDLPDEGDASPVAVPDEMQLRADLEGWSRDLRYRRWAHYWAVVYEVV